MRALRSNLQRADMLPPISLLKLCYQKRSTARVQSVAIGVASPLCSTDRNIHIE